MSMRRPPRASSKSIVSNPFAEILDDNGAVDDPIGRDPVGDHEECYNNNNHSDDDGDNDDDNSSFISRNRRQRPPRPSLAVQAPSKLTASAKRRRRRSSARFLQLKGGRRNSSHGVGRTSGSIGGGDRSSSQGAGNLTELYQKAIRMNAENKINAGNSWNLQLIENIDRFLEEDGNEGNAAPANERNFQTERVGDKTVGGSSGGSRVNFTKASCTLDASVKIYSYRVDDVHLTSYKVLANLNRSDTNKQKSNNADGANDGGTDHDNDGDDDDDGGGRVTKRSAPKHASTLETNRANINLNKLDSAFDIDPLFHKMSKTFDEGGARGLLLVNLGVGDSGCNIVFDSSQPDEDSKIPEMTDNSTNNNNRVPEGLMDCTSLTLKLESLLEDAPEDDIHEIPLVPQLSSLRAEHDSLDGAGFVDAAAALLATVGPKTPGKRRYHADASEEREAEQSIHQEAMDRSRLSTSVSAVRMRLLDDDDESGCGAQSSPACLQDHDNGDDDDNDGGGFDFGGGEYDDGDDDDDIGFETFMASNAARFSDVSFNTSELHAGGDTTTTNLLNAIASGATVLHGNDYAYFNPSSSNGWAGASHWKRPNASPSQKTKKSVKAKKKPTKPKSLVTFGETPDISHLLSPSTTGKTKSKRKTASTQLSKAMVTKYTNQENLLPLDAGYKVEQLTQLFLRPNAVLKQQQSSLSGGINETTIDGGEGKTVGFSLPTWDDGSYGGDDDDGGGFEFAGGAHDDNDDDEFLIGDLEGVRKVDKVQVGYAVVAKKVDVKRLKRDLWTELEHKFSVDAGVVELDAASDNDAPIIQDTNDESSDAAESEGHVVSFQEAVHDLEQQKTQMDVTLPFYFICVLHLANEKGLRLESNGLEDFAIHSDQAVLSALP